MVLKTFISLLDLLNNLILILNALLVLLTVVASAVFVDASGERRIGEIKMDDDIGNILEFILYQISSK